MAQTQVVLTDEEKTLVESQYNKAKLTIEILSEHLKMTMDEDNQDTMQPPQQNSPRTCILLQRCNYKIKSLESLIKLVLRCKKLYDAIQNVIKLLAQVHKMDSVFEEESLVKRLLLGEDKSDDGIQRKWDQIFAKSRPEVTQVAGQEEEVGPSLFVARSRISLARDLREGMKKGKSKLKDSLSSE